MVSGKKIFALGAAAFISALISARESQVPAAETSSTLTETSASADYNSSASDSPNSSASSAAIESSRLNLNILTLKNGLTLFILPDKNCALVNVELACRAGFASQTPSTCGFFSMYSKLLTQSAQEEIQNLFELVNLKSDCRSLSSNYSATIPPEEISRYFSALCSCLCKQDFSDKEIKELLDEMKKESKEYAESTTGFINSSIDARIFYKEPWKHDSGIYPSLFSDYSVSQARTILTNIGTTFYSPENCALFISGNVNPEELQEAAENAFALWKRTSARSAFNQASANAAQKNPAAKKSAKDKEAEDFYKSYQGRKFVLVSDGFSKEITQIVLQWTTLDSTKCQLLAQAMNQETSAYKNKLPAEESLCIRGSDYLTAASAESSGFSRLILQALFEAAPSVNSSDTKIIPQQAETFVQLAKESAQISRSDFVRAQNEGIMNFKLKGGNGHNMAEFLAAYWPSAVWTTPEEFYDGFMDSIYKVQSENEKEIAEKIYSEEPYVFLLVNSEKYKSQKNYFDEAGYIKIDEKNSSWWKQKMLAENAKAEKKQIIKEAKTDKTKIIKAKPAEYFYANSLKTIKEKKLKNGIPVLVKANKGSETVCVSVAINGGMTASPVEEKNLRTILVAALAKNSAIYGAHAETKETVSYLTFEVVKDEFENAMKKTINALIYGDIKPVQADRLFADENYRILMENADLGSQMKRNVFAYLYRGTKPGEIYRDYDNKNNSASYQSLLTGYTEFLDASLYSIVICGDVEFEKAFSAAEETFGILKEQKNREELKTAFPQPAWKNRERKVQLRHLYSSDLPPELAPKESPLLVPTKEFLDPVQLYFAAPETLTDIEKFNALLMEISSRLDKEIDSYCKAYGATKLIPVAYIHGNKIKKTDAFIKLYKKQRQNLIEELSDKEKCAETLRIIKTRYEISLLDKTCSNEGTAALLQESLLNGNATDYLSCYLEIENSSAQDFYDILTEYIPEEPLMKVHSVDGK